MYRLLIALALLGPACVVEEDLTTDEAALVRGDLGAEWSVSLAALHDLPPGAARPPVDPAAFDGQVTSGLSCANCHAVTGTLPKNDPIREVPSRGGARRP